MGILVRTEGSVIGVMIVDLGSCQVVVMRGCSDESSARLIRESLQLLTTQLFFPVAPSAKP